MRKAACCRGVELSKQIALANKLASVEEEKAAKKRFALFG